MNNVGLAVDGYDVPLGGEMVEQLVLSEAIDSMAPSVRVTLSDPVGLLIFGYEMNGTEEVTLRLTDDQRSVEYNMRIAEFVPEDFQLSFRAMPEGFFTLNTEKKADSYKGTPSFVVREIASDMGLDVTVENDWAPSRTWLRPAAWTAGKMLRYMMDRAYSRVRQSGGAVAYGRFPGELCFQHMRTLLSVARPELQFGGVDQPPIVKIHGAKLQYGRVVSSGVASDAAWFDMESGTLKTKSSSLSRPARVGDKWYIRKGERAHTRRVYIGRSDSGDEAEVAQATCDVERNLATIQTMNISVAFNLALHAGYLIETQVAVKTAHRALLSGRWLVAHVEHDLLVPETSLRLTRGSAAHVERGDLHVS